LPQRVWWTALMLRQLGEHEEAGLSPSVIARKLGVPVDSVRSQLARRRRRREERAARDHGAAGAGGAGLGDRVGSAGWHWRHAAARV